MKTVAEIESALRDRARADEVLSRVDKGGRGKFTYIPWNETARMMNETFGVFGWSTTKISSVDDIAGGVYIYDLLLTVRARDDEYGGVVEKTLTGRGVGLVGKKALESGDREAHDTAAKGARSDALSVAAKCLGEAFGIFLYDKGDPAHSDGYVASHSEGHAATTMPTSSLKQESPASQGATTTQGSEGSIGFASAKQVPILKKNQWTDAQIAELDKDTLRQVMDGIFGKGTKITPPKTVQGGGTLRILQPTGTSEEDF